MSDILDLARQEFSNVLVDLPGSWTNWSLSLVALADAVCLITEMSIPSLRQARRQLDMLASQDLGDLPIYVIVNRHERGFLKSIKTGKARSEEHTSELQSLMRISYAVFCLKKKKTQKK